MQSKTVNHAIEPTCRVFFAELLQSDFLVPENEMTFLITPTCAKCNRFFGVGEVQDAEIRGNISRIKLNDSTATLTIFTNKPIQFGNTLKATQKEKETFIAFIGNVHARESAGTSKRFIILADDVGAVEARIRSRWILATAKRTMERIELIRSIISSKKGGETAFLDTATFDETLEHYALDNDKLDALANMAINAVTSLWQHYHTTTKEEIVALIKKAGMRGMERAKIVRTLKTKGLNEALMEEVIDELIVEGQCYETEGGVIAPG